MNEEMLAEIRDLIAPIIEVEASQILPDAAFREDLAVDSMKVLEIIVALEDRYSVVFKPEHLAAWPVWRLLIDGQIRWSDLDHMSLDDVDLFARGIDAVAAARKNGRKR